MNKPKGRESILDLPRMPVKALRFPNARDVQVPGKGSTSAVATGRTHTVEYIPKIRHFLVSFNGHRGVERIMVHESIPECVVLESEAGEA